MDNSKFSKILIFGKKGQVCFELCRSLSYCCEVSAIDINEALAWCRTIADVTSLVLAKMYNSANKENFSRFSGIYNLTNSGQTSRYGFAKAIYSQLENGKTVTELAYIFPVKSSEYLAAADRSKNSVLNGHKLQQTFAFRTSEWHYSLQLI